MFIKFDTDIVDTGVDVVGFGVARPRGSGTLASVSSIFWSWRPYQRRGDTLFPPASINSEIGSVGPRRLSVDIISALPSDAVDL